MLSLARYATWSIIISAVPQGRLWYATFETRPWGSQAANLKTTWTWTSSWICRLGVCQSIQGTWNLMWRTWIWICSLPGYWLHVELTALKRGRTRYHSLLASQSRQLPAWVVPLSSSRVSPVADSEKESSGLYPGPADSGAVRRVDSDWSRSFTRVVPVPLWLRQF